MKIYPNAAGDTKKKKKAKKGEDAPEEKKSNLQITEKGVVAVQQFNIDIKDKEFIVLVGRGAQGPGHRHGVPELRPVPPHDRL